MKSLVVLSLCGALASLPLSATAQTAKRCLIGTYQLENGQTLDITPSRDGTLHWIASTGEMGRLRPQPDGSWTSTLGWTERPAADTLSSSNCKDGEKGAKGAKGEKGEKVERAEKGEIVFGGKRGHRIAFDVSETSFESNGVKLVGRLVLPKGKGPVPVVVLLHGSEQDSARDANSLQRVLPAEGIGAFVFDKRGTGGSGGAYTQDFEVLADDAVLAMREARRLAGPRAGRIGYQGGSQGGWIAPLAARRSPVDFAIVGFGLTVSMIDQDQQSVAREMRASGHSAQDTEKALELTRAGERVIESRGKDGYEAFDALRQKYKSEPWYKDVRGNFLHLVLPLDKAQIVEDLNTKYNFETSFRYDPMPTLRASTTPQLWILAGNDRVAPSAESAASIRSLIAAGKRYTLAVYPGADHGMTEYDVGPDGKRVSTRFPDGYFRMMRDFIRDGRIGDAYGNAVITLPAGGK